MQQHRHYGRYRLIIFPIYVPLRLHLHLPNNVFASACTGFDQFLRHLGRNGLVFPRISECVCFAHFLYFLEVNGRLRCLGSTQHLKHRFGRGFEADIKINPPSDSDVAEVMQRMVTEDVDNLVGDELDRYGLQVD